MKATEILKNYLKTLRKIGHVDPDVELDEVTVDGAGVVTITPKNVIQVDFKTKRVING